MGLELGRISGPMLKDNLLRNGVDLVFQNQLTDNLLYLDVNSSKIGINTDAATRELTVDGNAKTTDLIVDNQLNAGNVIISSALTQITTTYGDLNIATAPGGTVFAPIFKTDTFKIYENNIETYLSNADIEFTPHGTGKLLTGDTDVTGNLHATGNITLDGNIRFGNSDTDTITFNAEVTSNIVPDIDATYSLGNVDKKWLDLRSKLVNGEFLTTGDLSYPSIHSIALTPGKTWFVAANGSDSNAGQHENNPLATVAYALTCAADGDTIHIYPGTYTEVFPLFVPAGVSVKGPASLRSVTIVPTEDTKYNDCFLMNGGCTISNLTVKDFYYDAVNDTGYAFRFASVFQVKSRSPYVQNCSVITKGSVITPDDPRGYDSHDAGKGALVDGSVAAVEKTTTLVVITTDTTQTTADNMYITTDEGLVETYSGERAMLFHSVTFITPGVDGLTMTNGVRVEWLNSFTYYSNIGLYATNGSGRLSDGVPVMPMLFAAAAGGGGGPPPGPSLVTVYGAELRSIGSANVYGEYGAVADGDETLMYLIQHNFAYIGTGKDTENDITLVKQDQETSELNSGKIYYQSVDQQGNFRVGAAFAVDQNTGFVTLNGLGQNVTGINQINISDGTNQTFIDATVIQQNNIRIFQNTIQSTQGPINIHASDNEIYLNQNISVTKDLDVTGDFVIAGELFLGNQSADTVSFATFVENLVPKTAVTFDIGTNSLKWRTINPHGFVLEDIQLRDNTISTTLSNSNLELAASQTGIVDITELTAENNLSVNTTTDVKNTEITGSVDITGDTISAGTQIVNGTYALTGGLTTTSNPFSFGNIVALDNQLTTTESNSNLELRASGTDIYVPSNNVVLDNDLTVLGNTQVVDVVNINDTTATVFDVNTNILISSNYIEAQSTLNLVLGANGTGIVHVTSNDVEFGQQLVVDTGLTSLKDTTVIGALDLTGDEFLIGNKDQTGNLDLSNDFTVSATAKFGNVSFIGNTVSTFGLLDDLSLSATGIVSVPTNNVTISKNLTVDDTSYLNSLTNSNTISADIFYDTNIKISENFITTTEGPNDLELYAHGTGVVRFDDSFTVDNDIAVNGLTSLKNLSITNINQTGNVVQTGNSTLTGDRFIDGDITTYSAVLLTDISIINNSITTRSSNSDLELLAAGTGNILVPTSNVRINNNLTIVGTSSIVNLTNSGTFSANEFYNGDILISENFIETTLSSSTLELRGNLAGGVKLEKIKINNNVISAIDTNSNITFAPAAGKSLIVDTNTAIKLPIGKTIYGGANVTSTIAVDYTNASWEANNLKITNPSAFLIYLFSYLTPGTTFSGVLKFRYAYNDPDTVTTPTVTVAGAITNVGSVYTIPLTTIPGINYFSAIFDTLVIYEPAYNRTGYSGELRFSNQTNLFEAWENTSRPLAGIYSSDRKTTVTAGSINDLNFVANNIAAMEVKEAVTRVNSLLVSNNLDFAGDTITATSLNSDIKLFNNGTAQVNIDDISFIGNEIRNYSNSPFTLNVSATGHVAMNTVTALAIPSGGDAERPLSPEIGMVRYNTDSNLTEVFNGIQFVSLAGNSQTATLDEIQELNEIYSLILG